MTEPQPRRLPPTPSRAPEACLLRPRKRSSLPGRSCRLSAPTLPGPPSLGGLYPISLKSRPAELPRLGTEPFQNHLQQVPSFLNFRSTSPRFSCGPSSRSPVQSGELMSQGARGSVGEASACSSAPGLRALGPSPALGSRLSGKPASPPPLPQLLLTLSVSQINKILQK